MTVLRVGSKIGRMIYVQSVKCTTRRLNLQPGYGFPPSLYVRNARGTAYNVINELGKLSAHTLRRLSEESVTVFLLAIRN